MNDIDELIAQDRLALSGSNANRLVAAGAPLLDMLAAAPLFAEEVPRFLHADPSCEFVHHPRNPWDPRTSHGDDSTFLLCQCAQHHEAVDAVRAWRRHLFLVASLEALDELEPPNTTDDVTTREHLGTMWALTRRDLAFDQSREVDPQLPAVVPDWSTKLWERAAATLERVHQEAGAAWATAAHGPGRWVVTFEASAVKSAEHLAALVTWPTVHYSVAGDWCVQHAPTTPASWETASRAQVMDLGLCAPEDDAQLWQVLDCLWGPTRLGNTLSGAQALTAARGILAS